MRLLTGLSSNRRPLYTYSPSEPVLDLAAVDIIYRKDSWGPILETFTTRLCESGLIEKGLIGELGARTLLLIARDFAAPKKTTGGRDLLKPVLVMDFLYQLFGNNTWCSGHQAAFNNAFRNSHVNFTHWMVTRESLPEAQDEQLLANLYARGGALQCTFLQESVDLLIPVYTGPIADEAVFDAAALTAIVIQVKFRKAPDTKAEDALKPIGIPRDLHQPLPYLALLLELGTNSSHQETCSKIKTTVSAPCKDGEVERLTDSWRDAVDDLQQYQSQSQEKNGKKKVDKNEVKKKRAAIEEARISKDSYNRYTIAVGGISTDVFGILKQANIEAEFGTFLNATLPPPYAQISSNQHMKPIEGFGKTSGHTAWMSWFVKDEPECLDMDIELDVDTQ